MTGAFVGVVGLIGALVGVVGLHELENAFSVIILLICSFVLNLNSDELQIESNNIVSLVGFGKESLFSNPKNPILVEHEAVIILLLKSNLALFPQ